MARRRFSVRDIDEILAYWHQTGSIQSTATSLGVHREARFASTLNWLETGATCPGVPLRRKAGLPSSGRRSLSWWDAPTLRKP
jgi:hypothetical protein